MKAIKIKSRDCRETLAHPDAEPGSYGDHSIFAVENVPDSVSATEVLLWFRKTNVRLGQRVISFLGEAQS